MVDILIALVVGFISGFAIAARFKDNINIGFGNQSITMIDGEIQKPKKTKSKFRQRLDDQLEKSRKEQNNTECICERQAKGENIGGWCPKHKTDWI